MSVKKNKFRLYIDEVGHHMGFKDENNLGQRYLSLTGIIFDLKYVADVVAPSILNLKSEFFPSHPDDPIILHRKEIVNKKPPFQSLQDENIEKRFNQKILKLFSELECTVITVVLDKKEFKDQYTVWHHHPYHYCLEVMVERFVLYLEDHDITGDVLCESRGGREDKQLKESFKRLWKTGTNYVSDEKFQKYLTSCQLKVKPKISNIAGLQIADLLAYPSLKSILFEKNHYKKSHDTFGEKIVTILENGKYYQGHNEKIWGYGKKWLP
ncbi:MAG: DUF3800 domain-containing protein [Candidatus Marinimicrobia bacterium]|nr:DUF3800 domain-containing protein [Candidatus Neomarinimicrobiota bacterium]